MWLWRGGLTGAEETGAKAGMRERSGGGRFVPLSFLVFLVGGDDVVWGGEGRERREAARQEGGGNPSGGGNALPQLVKMTKCCGEREGRELAHEGGG